MQFDAEATGGKQVWSEELAFRLFQRSGSSRFLASQWDAQLLHLGASVRLHGLAYSTGAAPSFYRESYGHIWLSTRSPREALPVVQQLLADLKTAGPEASELDAAREGIRTRLLSRSDDPWDLASTLSDWQLVKTAAAGGRDGALSLTDLIPLFVSP